MRAVQQHGRHWSLIAHVMGNRTGAQCRERFCNKLDPEIYRGAWTAEEDQRLRDAVDRIGVGKWAQIAKVLHPPRTDYQIRKRWYIISRGEGTQSSTPTSPTAASAASVQQPPPQQQQQPLRTPSGSMVLLQSQQQQSQQQPLRVYSNSGVGAGGYLPTTPRSAVYYGTPQQQLQQLQQHLQQQQQQQHSMQM